MHKWGQHLQLGKKTADPLQDRNNSDLLKPRPQTGFHNLAIATKKNGELRLCLDLKNLSEQKATSIAHSFGAMYRIHSDPENYFQRLMPKAITGLRS